MKKKCKILIFLFGLFTFALGNNVNAVTVDPSAIGSLDVSYYHEDVKLSKARIEVYRVAGVSENIEYYYIDDFVNAKQSSLSGITSVRDLEIIADGLNKYIDLNKITATSIILTDQNSDAKISNLPTGAYLIRTETIELDGYKYSSKPAIVSIPYNDDGKFLYDVKINVKTLKEKIDSTVDPKPTDDPSSNPNNPSDGNGNSNNSNNIGNNNGIIIPNTLDKIYLYVGIFILSLSITFIILYIIYKEQKNKV